MEGYQPWCRLRHWTWTRGSSGYLMQCFRLSTWMDMHNNTAFRFPVLYLIGSSYHEYDNEHHRRYPSL